MKPIKTLFACAVISSSISMPLLADPPNESSFGRMFPSLPLYSTPEPLLVSLAASMQDPNAPEGDSPDGTPSGFTYLGQFLDHDITLDRTPLGAANTVDALVNGRTAKLDLDSMYGGGPEANPFIYDGAGKFRFLTPNGFEDFIRNETGVASIPESRNDENLVIAQIHIALQKFHNSLVTSGKSFAEAQKLTQWHWQWVVVHDFLPKICGQNVVDRFLTEKKNGKPKFKSEFYAPGNKHNPMTPVEFSMAAYRFGHSMVRLAYVLPTGSVTKTQVFNLAGNDLRGNRAIPLNLKIDFANFFDFPGVPQPAGRNVSRRIDALISRSLFALPIGPVVPNEPPAVTSLAERNLLRGNRIGLPSYQDVATAMGITPITNEQMGLTDPAWNGKAPLWYGILKESEIVTNGTRLGPTGARIVAEVILGFIDADKDSYFHSPQPWEPAGGSFSVTDLISK